MLAESDQLDPSSASSEAVASRPLTALILLPDGPGVPADRQTLLFEDGVIEVLALVMAVLW